LIAPAGICPAGDGGKISRRQSTVKLAEQQRFFVIHENAKFIAK